MTWLGRYLGTTLREARAERGWSQERLAEAAGLDRSYVGEIERGLVSPSLATLEKLAMALGLRTSAFIRRIEQHWNPGDPKDCGRSPVDLS